jgi:hypothetical protein
MLRKPYWGLLHLAVNIPIARGELIAKQMEEGKVDLVSAVGIRGMYGRLDVGGIIEQDIKET